MKYFVISILIILSQPIFAQGRIEITTDDSEGVRWLDFYVDNIKASYGMELELFYPTNTLSAVDLDQDKAGPQIMKGDFFSDSAYVIANNIDVRTGRVRFAVSLLKPAEPVSGSGHIARIGFLTKSSSAVTAKLVNIKFGTQSGEVLDVQYPNKVVIEPSQSLALTSTAKGFKPSESNFGLNKRGNEAVINNGVTDSHLIIGLLALIGILLFMVIVLLFRRKPVIAS